jgi:lysophospholipase L1-like esterase/predicted esterase
MLGFALQRAIPRANIEMINAGISGHTTVNALARIDTDVLAKQPDLVVVMFGMNDVTRVSLDDFRDNIETIARRCQEQGAAVLLCTPNSVYENDARPNKKLTQFSQAVRELAEKMRLPLVDVFQHWQQLRDQDLEAWMLAMSDTIHPNMNGHKRFAQLIAKEITGKSVELDDIRPPSAALYHTFDRARAGESIKLIAMPPYDELLPKLMRDHFPDAEFEIVCWPTEDQSVTQLAEWAKQIRTLRPDLVVPAVPVNASAIDTAAWIADYEWVLNWSFQFAGRPWDVVPVCASVELERNESQQVQANLARQILLGKDVRFIDRDSDDKSTKEEIVADWVSVQKRTWQAARNELPTQNDHVYLSAQSWPQWPGPRTVKVSIHYPGGEHTNVNDQTGIMLTLHNWGGEDCIGTADPQALADRLNVVAVCVNYLQSGPRASVEDSRPYDVGYLQALDGLRALAYVRNGLKQADRSYDDGRIFCTGGSGGGNVTLMANKLAPRTFACVIDMCGMKKLSDDIAYNEPGGSQLNARWSRDRANAAYLSPGEQEIRFVGNPSHLQTMKRMESSSKIVVVHGVKDTTCPFADAQEMVTNMRSAGLDIDVHFIDDADLDGKVFTSPGHALGNRTEIVFRVAEKYLSLAGANPIRRTGPTDFDRGDEVAYRTTDGGFVISYQNGIPIGRFEPSSSSDN